MDDRVNHKETDNQIHGRSLESVDQTELNFLSGLLKQPSGF